MRPESNELKQCDLSCTDLFYSCTRRYLAVQPDQSVASELFAIFAKVTLNWQNWCFLYLVFTEILGEWKAFSKSEIGVKLHWRSEFVVERFESVRFLLDVFAEIKEDTGFVTVFEGYEVFHADGSVFPIVRNHGYIDGIRSTKHLWDGQGDKEAMDIRFGLEKIRRAPGSNWRSFWGTQFRNKKRLRSRRFQSWHSRVLMLQFNFYANLCKYLRTWILSNVRNEMSRNSDTVAKTEWTRPFFASKTEMYSLLWNKR